MLNSDNLDWSAFGSSPVKNGDIDPIGKNPLDDDNDCGQGLAYLFGLPSIPPVLL